MSKSPESKNPAAWKKFFSKQSGLVSYLGTNDVLKITERMESGDALAKDLLDGMAHMIAREIAAYAAGLEWQVDGIGITGAIARSGYIVGILQRETAFIAESFVFPGEFEMEGLADGGVLCGLPRATAQRLAAQMLLGNAKLALESGQHTGQLKDAICSPGGTTIAGVRKLEQLGFRSAAMETVIAAYEKTLDLKK